MTTIHYIDEKWNSKFIIAKTECGIDWENADDSTQHKKLVTCKKCIKKIDKSTRN
jgi:hypothetical protein